MANPVTVGAIAPVAVTTEREKSDGEMFPELAAIPTESQ